jgi:YVTN family beta-propeller protein
MNRTSISPVELAAGSRRRRITLLFLAVLLGWFVQARPLGAEERVYVGNTDSGDLSVISVPRLEVIATVKIGTYPDDVVASHNGRFVYANRVQSMGHPFSKHAGESGEAVAVSTDTNQVLWRTKIDGWPQHLALSFDDRRLYMALFDRMWIDIIDTDKHEVIDRLPAAMGSHAMKLSPDGKRLYVGSMFMDVLMAIDLATKRPMKRISFADAVRPFAFTKDEQRMYVQLSRLHGFEVVDLSKGKVIRRVELPTLPAGTKLPEFFPNTYNHGLALSPDERLLFASGSVGNYVCVYTQPALDLQKTIPVGKDPNWVVFTKDGRLAFVSNRGSDTVSVIGVDELREIKQIPVGKYPQRMTVAEVP